MTYRATPAAVGTIAAAPEAPRYRAAAPSQSPATGSEGAQDPGHARAVVAAALLSLVVAVVWLILPQGRDGASTLLGSSFFVPDDLLNLSILEWGRRSILSGHWTLFQWPVGYPVPYALAATETLLGWQWLYTPLRAAGASMTAAYDACAVVSFAIAGGGAALLSTEFGASRRGAVLAGVIFALSYIHVALLIQFQSLAVCWLPLDFWLLHRFATRGQSRYLLGYSLAFIVTALSSIYFGVFCALLTGLWLVARSTLTRTLPSRWTVAGLTVAAAGVLLAMMPVMVPYVRFARAYGYQHAIAEHVARSISVVGFFRLPHWTLAGRLAATSNAGASFPGFVTVGLALAVLLLRRRQSRGEVLFLTLMALACVVFAMGPVLKVFDYPTLGGRVTLPGRLLTLIPGIRVPSRWAACGLLFGAILAGLGADALASKLRPRAQQPLFLVLTAMFLLENWPSPAVARNSVAASKPLAMSSAYTWLARTRPAGASVELPTGDSTGTYNRNMSLYVYGAIGHGQPVVSFYASHPIAVLDSLQGAATSLPSESGLAVLRAHGVRRVIVHEPLMPPASYQAFVQRMRDAGYPREYESSDAVVFALPEQR